MVERDLLHLEIAKYRLESKVYTNSQSIMEELKANGFDVTEQYRVDIDESLKIANNPKTRTNFKDMFKQYCEHVNTGIIFSLGQTLAQQIAEKRPLVKEAYDKLGEDVVKSLDYNVNRIERKLISLKQTSLIDRIIRMCKREFTIGSPITLPVVKSKLQAMYDELGIKRTAKATDIDEWCETIDSSIYHTGQKVKCKTIVRYKIVRFKN